jgi:hypothetical protein
MTADPGRREPRGRRPDFSLPAVRSVTARRASFTPPPRRNFESRLPTLESTVEFEVETEAPIPIRALGPVLYVGDTPTHHLRADDETHHRFVALRPDELREGAPITLGWTGDPPASRTDTGQTFTAP